MIGLQTALLPAASWRDGLAQFLRLADGHGLRACELHLATDHYAAALPATEESAREVAATLRPAVVRLGVHLGFSPLDDAATERAAAELGAGLAFAARAGADYAVLHLRGPDAPAAAWAARVAPLARRARELDLRLLLENADDARGPALVRKVAAAAAAGLCLDIGHLYERIYPPQGLARKLLVANDRFHPRPFACRRGLPADAGPAGWPAAVEQAGAALACVHVHDHDGRRAHLPLGRGRLRWGPLAGLRERLAGIPVILEADYRCESPERVSADVIRLRKLLEP